MQPGGRTSGRADFISAAPLSWLVPYRAPVIESYLMMEDGANGETVRVLPALPKPETRDGL